MPLMQTVRLPNIGLFFGFLPTLNQKYFHCPSVFFFFLGRRSCIFLLCLKNEILSTILTRKIDLWSFFSRVKILVWHSGPENLKKSRAKKNSWNKINQFHEKIFFDQIPFFCNFKNDQKSIFELGRKFRIGKKCNFMKNSIFCNFKMTKNQLGKSLKLPKMQF